MLANLSPSDASIVYNDVQYGMNKIQSLIYWVGAWLETPSTPGTSYNLIVSHFADLGVVLTPTIMNNIVGPASMLGFICTNL